MYDFIIDVSKINRPFNNSDSKKYGAGKEATMVRDEIGDFDITSSKAMTILKTKFGNSLRTTELKGIIYSITDYLEQKKVYLPKLTRNAKRSFLLLVKYVDDNFEIFKDILPHVTLCDEDGKNIVYSHY